MKWEDFKKHKINLSSAVMREKTNITCPICNQFLWKRLDRILASNPPQYQYECDGCGFVGYHVV